MIDTFSESEYHIIQTNKKPSVIKSKNWERIYLTFWVYITTLIVSLFL